MDYREIGFYLLIITSVLASYSTLFAVLSGLFMSVNLEKSLRKIYFPTVVMSVLALMCFVHIFAMLLVIVDVLQYSSFISMYGSVIAIISVVSHLLILTWFSIHLTTQLKEKFSKVDV
jgi:hypothetical protein